MKKLHKLDFIFIGLLGIIVVFTVSFSAALKIYGSKTTAYKSNSEKVDKLTSAGTIERILSDNTNIILKLQREGKDISVKNTSLTEIKMEIDGDCTLTKLKNYYLAKDYSFISEGSEGITFSKESKFNPQKYYLGITDEGFVAIFKCNSDGVLFVEDKFNDISNRDSESLSEKDREYLKKFEYEFSTKEEAQDELAALCS